MDKNSKIIFFDRFRLSIRCFFVLPNNDDFYCLSAPYKFQDIMSFCQMELFGGRWMLCGVY